MIVNRVWSMPNAEHTKASWRAKHLDEIARIVKPDGYCLSFGWNTNGVGKKRGFEIVEILVVAHGGSKNDTLCTVERKTDYFGDTIRSILSAPDGGNTT